MAAIVGYSAVFKSDLNIRISDVACPRVNEHTVLQVIGDMATTVTPASSTGYSTSVGCAQVRFSFLHSRILKPLRSTYASHFSCVTLVSVSLFSRFYREKH